MPRSPNKLLAALPANEFRRIAPRLHTLRLSNGSVLPHCGVSRVYFPGTGVCSITNRMSDTTTIEVATVGSEGIVGLRALGGQFDRGTYLHVTHGTVQYMSMPAFEGLCVDSELGEAVQRFCATFLSSVMQLASCNQAHSLESRCARWLISLHQRVDRGRFEVTQPFLAMALGASPAQLAPVMTALAAAQIVKYDAATVTVLDAIALRRRACRCHVKLEKQTRVARPARRRRTNTRAPANVVPIRLSHLPACTICGVNRNLPHKTHADCLRAVDADLKSHLVRARQLSKLRAEIATESMKKFEQFVTHRHS